jgi:hypothetical protein
MITMGEHCSLENLDITFTSSASTDISMTCIKFIGTTSKTSKIINCNITVNNSTVTKTLTTDLTGIQFNGSNTAVIPTVAFTSVFGTSINIYSNGNGKKRGILVDSSNNTYIKNTNVYVDAPREVDSSGSYIGIETNDTQELGTIQIRTTSIGTVIPTLTTGYTASDILQTTPTTMTNDSIGYLTSPGIQVGPGTDLINKTAGGKGFFTYVYPTIIYYGLKGTLQNITPGYLWPGTQAVSNNNFPDPSGTPPAYFRIQQKCILLGMMASLNIATDVGHPITITVYYTPITTGIVTQSLFTLTLTDTVTINTFYNSSLTLNPSDKLHVFVNYSKSGIPAHDLTVQLDLF